MGASQGMGGTARAQFALRNVFVYTKAPVLPGPEVLVANAAEQFDEAGQLKSDEAKKFVGDLLERLVEAARRPA